MCPQNLAENRRRRGACVALPASDGAVPLVRVAARRSGCATWCRAAPARRARRRRDRSASLAWSRPSPRRSARRRAAPSPSPNSDRRGADQPPGSRVAGPRLGPGAQASQGPASRGDVLVPPQRLVVGHRLAPVGQGEAGVGALAPAGRPRWRLRTRSCGARRGPRGRPVRPRHRRPWADTAAAISHGIASASDQRRALTTRQRARPGGVGSAIERTVSRCRADSGLGRRRVCDRACGTSRATPPAPRARGLHLDLPVAVLRIGIRRRVAQDVVVAGLGVDARQGARRSGCR